MYLPLARIHALTLLTAVCLCHCASAQTPQAAFGYRRHTDEFVLVRKKPFSL
jgi:hypothetical protein